MTVEKIKELLKAFYEKWPVNPEKHCFTYDHENDKLLLSIRFNDMWYTFNPETDELDDPAKAIEAMSKWLT